MAVARRVLLKNFAVLLLGWSLTEGTTSVVGGIESSLNSDQGLGTVSLSVTRGTQILGCFLVNFVLNRLGCKWTAVLSSALCVPYVAIHFFPVWATMIPTSILQGIGNSFMGVSRCFYLTKISELWAQASGKEPLSMVICFISIFDSLFYLLLMFINISSSFALGKMSSTNHLRQLNVSDEVYRFCGYHYCNEDLGTSFHPGSSQNYSKIITGLSRGLPKSNVYRFVALCFIMIVVGCLLMAILLDPLKDLGVLETKDLTGSSRMSPLQRYKEAVLLMKHPNMLLLLPMPLYSNAEASFYMADFSKAFSVCAFGLQYVGLVTASVDLTAPIATFVSGFFSQRSLRVIPFGLAFAISGSALVSIMYSQVWIGHLPSMMAVSGIWGISRGILNSRVFAIFGVIFPHSAEIAYTACSLAFAVSGSVFFALDHVVCVRSKVIGLLALLLLSAVTYLALELNVRKCQHGRHQSIETLQQH